MPDFARFYAFPLPVLNDFSDGSAIIKSPALFDSLNMLNTLMEPTDLALELVL